MNETAGKTAESAKAVPGKTVSCEGGTVVFDRPQAAAAYRDLSDAARRLRFHGFVVSVRFSTRNGKTYRPHADVDDVLGPGAFREMYAYLKKKGKAAHWKQDASSGEAAFDYEDLHTVSLLPDGKARVCPKSDAATGRFIPDSPQCPSCGTDIPFEGGPCEECGTQNEPPTPGRAVPEKRVL